MWFVPCLCGFNPWHWAAARDWRQTESSRTTYRWEAFYHGRGHVEAGRTWGLKNSQGTEPENMDLEGR